MGAWHRLGMGVAHVGSMNLIALSTGLALQPKRMWQAFQRGLVSLNLYPSSRRAELDAGRWLTIADLRNDTIETQLGRAPAVLRVVEFCVYAVLAMAIHVCLAVPAVIARFVTDMTLGYSVFQAVKPKTRLDLY